MVMESLATEFGEHKNGAVLNEDCLYFRYFQGPVLQNCLLKTACWNNMHADVVQTSHVTLMLENLPVHHNVKYCNLEFAMLMQLCRQKVYFFKFILIMCSVTDNLLRAYHVCNINIYFI